MQISKYATNLTNVSIWAFHSQENYCHQMSDFKAKMHQNLFLVGLWPRPRWGNLQRSLRPDRPPAGVKGTYF